MYDFKTFQFGAGKHQTRKQGMCVMEAVSYLAGEPHSDAPECASPVVTRLAIWVNDSCNDKLRNELLRDLPWRIVGTKASDEIEQRRAYMAADWAVRFVCPILLRRAGLESEAAKLESLAVIDCYAAAGAAAGAAGAAAYAAGAAAYAAYAAAYAAYAAGAAGAAAYAAGAAGAAARAAAGAAAHAAADDLEVIQRSCVELIDRMIRLTEPQERVAEQPIAEVAAT